MRAALATIAETDEDARLVELEVSGLGDVTVVVSDLATGIPEVVHNGETGYRLPADDAAVAEQRVPLLALRND